MGEGTGVGEGLAELADAFPPHPVATVIIASSNSGAAKAGLSENLRLRGASRNFWATSPNGARARINQNAAGGAFNRKPGNMDALAVVLTLTLTVDGVPGVTATLPAGPLQAALGGAPAQLMLTLIGPPLAASWS